MERERFSFKFVKQEQKYKEKHLKKNEYNDFEFRRLKI